MTPAESLALTRFVRAACPQQKFDEYTPDAWHELLGDLAAPDCRDAAKNLGRRQTFISPAEIRTEVRRIRADRIRAVPATALEPVDVDPDDVHAYKAAHRAIIRSVGDGNPPPATPQLPARPVEKLLETAVKALRPIPPALPITGRRATEAEIRATFHASSSSVGLSRGGRA